MKLIINYVFAVIIIVFSSCTSGNQSEGDLTEDIKDAAVQGEKVERSVEISDDVMFDIISSIPAPLETAALVKKIGAKYKEDLLNSADNAANYNTNFKKATNLGIYGADIGYINLYNEAAAAIIYLSSLKRLADDLKVGQFFDFTTMKRVATNRDNLDSLLYITSKGFDKMNKLLKEQERGNISVYMLMGGWIEALYLSAQITNDNPDKELIERIGEQKVSLDDIRLLLSVFKADPNVNEIMRDFDDLKAIYEKVKITYTYMEPTAKEENGYLTIIDNNRSQVEIDMESVNNIREKVSYIRNKLIN